MLGPWVYTIKLCTAIIEQQVFKTVIHCRGQFTAAQINVKKFDTKNCLTSQFCDQ
jgi:hypothetical protein